MNQLLLQSTLGEVLCPLPLGPAPGLPPNVVTATVYDHAGAVLVAAATPAVVSWATSANAAQGASSLALTSWGTSRVPQRGEVLLLAASSSPASAIRERVVVESVTSTSVVLREPLEAAWGTGTKMYPVVQRIALSAANTATLGRRYRVRLSVTLIGAPATEAPQTRDVLFDVVAHIPQLTLTLEEIRTRSGSMFSDLSGWTAMGQGGWDAVLDLAFVRVLEESWDRGYKLDLAMADTELREATYWQLCQSAVEDGIAPSGWTVDAWTQRVDAHLKAARTALTAQIEWLDTDQTLEPTDDAVDLHMSGEWLQK